MILIGGMELGNQSLCAQGQAICVLIFPTCHSLILDGCVYNVTHVILPNSDSFSFLNSK